MARMNPRDVTPLRTDPDTIPDPVRHRVHKRRCDSQHAADTARTKLLDTLIATDTPEADAVGLVDMLIMTVRTADADRLVYAQSTLRDEERWEFWDGVNDLNGAVAFLRDSTHAHPVRDIAGA